MPSSIGGDVAEQDRVTVALAGRRYRRTPARTADAAARAQRERRGALLDAAAGNLGVLRLQRARHVGDGEVVGAQPRRIERDVDLAGAAAETTTWPTPFTLSSCRRSVLSAYSVMSRIGLFADTASVRTGAASGSNFSTVGCSIVFGSSGSTRLTRSRTSCAAMSASFSSRNETMTCETPSDEFERSSSMRADRVDRFLDLVGDLGLDFLRRGAGQARRDDDGREVDLRKAIEAELVNAKAPTTVSDEDQDAGKNGTLDGDRCEPLHDESLMNAERV